MTLREVCRVAGVAKSTISHVLNDKPGVSDATRERLRRVIRELGYRPKPAARHLSMARTDTLACVFQDLTPGWLLNIYRGVLAQAAEEKFHVVTALSVSEHDQFELPTHVLGTASVDGLLWLDPRATPDLVRRFQREQDMPFVVLQGHLPDRGIATVSIENVEAARRAVRHLLELGRRRLLLITGQPENPDSRQKLEGARLALRDAGLPLDPALVLNGHHVDDFAVRALADYLRAGHPLPDAIFAFNDNMALAVQRWLAERGIRVPDQVALAGFDGLEEARRANLTTIETPMRELGVQAVRLLVEMIRSPAGTRAARHIVLDGALAPRASTLGSAPPA